MADKTSVQHFTDDNFEDEVTKNDKPVLVDFWAVWCAPCRAIAPHIEELANQYSGQVKIGKLNVDEHPNTASSLGIRALPTLLLFKNGQVVEQVVGAVSKNKLDEMIRTHL
jgi:thioredoxin 1